MRIIILGCGRVGERRPPASWQMKATMWLSSIMMLTHWSGLARISKGAKSRAWASTAMIAEAGIERADAFAATSSSDNANIVAARIARNVFKVPRW